MVNLKINGEYIVGLSYDPESIGQEIMLWLNKGKEMIISGAITNIYKAVITS